MSYSEDFKARLAKRLVEPESISAKALSRESGIYQATLSRWLREARNLPSMSDRKKKTREKSIRQWPASEKMRVVIAAAALSDDQLGAFLRAEGLREAQLVEWRGAMLGGLQGVEAKKVRELERELRRKEKALAEMTALHTLKKKVQEIWGEEDDDIDAESGR